MLPTALEKPASRSNRFVLLHMEPLCEFEVWLLFVVDGGTKTQQRTTRPAVFLAPTRPSHLRVQGRWWGRASPASVTRTWPTVVVICTKAPQQQLSKSLLLYLCCTFLPLYLVPGI